MNGDEAGASGECDGCVVRPDVKVRVSGEEEPRGAIAEGRHPLDHGLQRARGQSVRGSLGRGEPWGRASTGD